MPKECMTCHRGSIPSAHLRPENYKVKLKSYKKKKEAAEGRKER
jgi:hypothetical protein